MKKLIIPQIPENIQKNNISEISSYLLQIPAQEIDKVNWKKDYPYEPKVTFRLAADNEAFYIRFDVREKYIRALADKDGGRVWLDSCVEFFLSPDSNDNYYNLEFNCIGMKVLNFRAPEKEPELASKEIFSKIRCESSLGNTPFPEKKGDFTWHITAIIPFSTYWNNPQKFAGKSMKANFYKCGDELTEAHFLSWNEIFTENPSFHQPGFFGEIILPD